MSDFKIIDEREDFAELINLILEKNHLRYAQFGKWESPHIKTYLIESNVENPLKLPDMKIEGIGISPTDAQDFYRIKTETQPNAGFIDTSNERIWKLFSLIKSKETDDFMRHFVDETKYLDRCWHSNNQLKQIEADHVFRGLGIQYEDFFSDTSDEVESASEGYPSEEVLSERRRTSFKIWTQGSMKEHEKELYNIATKYFSRNSIRIQRIDENQSRYLNEIYYDGKITTTFARRPNDIINLFPNMLIKKYLRLLNIIEENRGIFGSPIEIISDKPLPIHKMKDYFRKGKAPFRLWLSPIEENENFVRLYGVDLHTGQDIGIDIGLDYIWINIPKNTCGNAGLRIPTLLSFAFPYQFDICLEGERLIV